MLAKPCDWCMELTNPEQGQISDVISQSADSFLLNTEDPNEQQII